MPRFVCEPDDSVAELDVGSVFSAEERWGSSENGAMSSSPSDNSSDGTGPSIVSAPGIVNIDASSTTMIRLRLSSSLLSNKKVVGAGFFSSCF